MKKVLLVLFAILACITIFYIFSNRQENDINGQITYCAYNNNVHGAYVMDINTDRQSFIPDCISIKLLAHDEVLLGQYKAIKKSNLKAVDEQISYCIEEPIDFFAVISDSIISFSSEKRIFIFDLNRYEKTMIVEDNGSKYHGWLSGSLIYANTNDEVIEYNLYDNTKKKLFDGREPIASSDNNIIAYKDFNGKLHTFNINTNEQYIYNGSAYYYCLSPKSDMLLIEDEMKLSTVLKNILFRGKIIGHRVVVWDYKDNTTFNVLDECIAGAGEGFSWQ